MPYKRSYRKRRITKKKSFKKAIFKKKNRFSRPKMTTYDGHHFEKLVCTGELRHDPLKPWCLAIAWNTESANPNPSNDFAAVNKSTDWGQVEALYRYYRIRGVKVEVFPNGAPMESGAEILYSYETYSFLATYAQCSGHTAEMARKCLDHRMHQSMFGKGKVTRYYRILATTMRRNVMPRGGWHEQSDPPIDFGYTFVKLNQRATEFDDPLGTWRVTYYVEFKDRNPYKVTS